ncbi:MAG: M23 family metallopeptidase [Devosia sp.]|nr:M23 family metallopeptidase [Devosia sp.]
MSIQVPLNGLRNTAALVAILAATSGLAGCSTFGMGAGDPTTTGSTGYSGTSNLSQPMPSSLGARTQVAEGQYIPPEDVGSSSPAGSQSYASLPTASTSSSITSQDLPVIGSTTNGNPNAMSAQPAQYPLVPNTLAPKAVAAAPNLSVVQSAAYTHVIRSGESLYTIAKHYGVTAQAIMQASAIPAPDKIFVGQRVIIPGRPDLLAAMDHVTLPASNEKLPLDSGKPTLAGAEPQVLHGPANVGALPETRVASLGDTTTPVVPMAGRVLTNSSAAVTPAPAHANNAGEKPQAAKPLAATAPALTPSSQPAPAATQTASIAPSEKLPLQEPAMSGADKFRWPVSGKVVVDFASSKGTGINIAAPEGTPVKAAENGTVIYVGSGVEGYGNLILIRHANGYVSAYANLKDMSVQKGAVVNRGDTIGSTGTTGSVSSPQLHFELRKGATPVDPVPLLG